ncbi:MAG: glutathione S-transferase family protein [Acidobacteriota bacterium]
MQLFGTPLSHFTRKIRILLGELGVPFELVRPESLLATTSDAYADHPLMRVPTLIDGDVRLVESDHIARYVVGKHDPGDRFGVRSEDVGDLNRLAVVNGIMANEVVLILAKRGGFGELDSVAYFRKLAAAIDSGLAWLDRTLDPDAPAFDYRDIATICMWQHLRHYQLVPGLDRHARIAARVARFAERPAVATTAPARQSCSKSRCWRSGSSSSATTLTAPQPAI